MRRLLPTLLLASLAACGGGDPAETGYSAFGSGDYATAASSFREALAGAEGTRATDLTLELCKSLAHTDAAACVTEMKALDAKTELRVPDYNVVVSELKSAGAINESIDVLALAQEAYPDDAKLDALGAALVEAAQSSGNDAALAKLKGLGYVGND